MTGPFTGLSLLGGLLALDQTSVGQTMASRPLVAGVATGWILGAPLTGLAVGGVLEALFLPAFPVGGSRFPETGPSAVVGAAAAVWTGGPAGVPLGVALGLAWAFLGDATIQVMRRRREGRAVDPEAGTLRPAAVVRAQVREVTVDFLRGAVLTGAGLLLADRLLPELAGAWPLNAGGSGVVLGLAGALSLGGLASCYALRGWRIGALLAGLVAGGAVGAFL